MDWFHFFPGVESSLSGQEEASNCHARAKLAYGDWFLFYLCTFYAIVMIYPDVLLQVLPCCDADDDNHDDDDWEDE